MSYSKEDLLTFVGRIRLDLRDATAKVNQLAEMVASLPVPETRADVPACPHCGELRAVRNEQQLAEHLENVHGKLSLPLAPAAEEVSG